MTILKRIMYIYTGALVAAHLRYLWSSTDVSCCNCIQSYTLMQCIPYAVHEVQSSSNLKLWNMTPETPARPLIRNANPTPRFICLTATTAQFSRFFLPLLPFFLSPRIPSVNLAVSSSFSPCSLSLKACATSPSTTVRKYHPTISKSLFQVDSLSK